jgi:hypothetical protein
MGLNEYFSGNSIDPQKKGNKANESTPQVPPSITQEEIDNLPGRIRHGRGVDVLGQAKRFERGPGLILLDDPKQDK